MQLSEPARSSLTPAQRARVDLLLDELLDLPERQRSAHLQTLNIDDPMVVAEVASLLCAASASAEFLSKPARPAAAEDVAAAALGSRMGAWRINRLIGRGGMGDVYAASRAQADFDQTVAIKVLQREAGAQLERFQAERQILARLEHPAIARLYDGGVTVDARPYMVMEYVEGRPITEYCAIVRASLEDRLRLFAQVCDAVAYAHQHLVVHRDLKPTNILVTDAGMVKLLDFGIAKLLDPQIARTTQASVAPLTPSCAAPEQLTGGLITTATDVYALGLLLFELLTGAHPWLESGTPVLQAMRTILQRPAPVASQVAARVGSAPVPARLIRGDMDAIIAKALREEPAHRYATVAALKADIERVLLGEPIDARKGAHFYVIGRTLRRYRWVMAALLASLSAALAVAGWQTHQALLARDSARRDESREEAVRSNLTRLFRAALADQGVSAVSGKTMSDDSAQRALRDIQVRPELAGQIVMTLADIYGAMEDVTGAASLLEGFVNQADPQVDPAALADARQKLADIELLRGQTEYAGQLLDQADAFWVSSPRPYREERLDGLIVRAHLQRARGDLPGAIAATRTALAQRIALSGREHRETAIQYNSFAIVLTAAGRFDEALAAYHEATAIYRALGLGDGLDAQIILANNGTLELQIGHLKVAETLLTSALARERSLAGDTAALAAAMGYYGKLLSVTNRNDPAVQVLREAVNVALRFGGADSALAMQNRLFLGAALAKNGDRQGALATLNDVHVAALTQFGDLHPLELRARVALAELAAADGDANRAQAQLVTVIGALRKAGTDAEGSLAQALQALGELQLRSGQTSAASSTFREAVAQREKVSGNNWELAQARERWGESLVKSGSPQAAAILDAAARSLESQLGTNHPETLRARGAIAQARQHTGV